MITSSNVILTAAFLGYHLTEKEARDIFLGNPLKIRSETIAPHMKANHADQFQLIPESEMPFNLAGQPLPPEPPQETTNTEKQPDLIP
jgi:hypothetical protein